MLERAGDSRLGDQGVFGARVGPRLRGLERHVPPERPLPREPHLPHPAASDELRDLKVRGVAPGDDARVAPERDRQLRQPAAAVTVPRRRVPASDREVESPGVDVGPELEPGQDLLERRQR